MKIYQSIQENTKKMKLVFPTLISGAHIVWCLINAPFGLPGTGKTTTILAVCKELFGPEYYKSRVKELNASDDRGALPC